MHILRSDWIEDQVIKNSLTAMEQSASKGDAKSVIRLAKFLLKSFNKRNDVSVDISMEKENTGTANQE